MGKYEVLGFLMTLRMNGNDNYYSYTKIHMQLLEYGMTHSERATYRVINQLWNDGLLEARIEGDILHRKVLFRAKIPKNLNTLQVKRVHNKNRELVGNRGAPTKGRPTA